MEPRDWERELESARALTRSTIALVDRTLDTLAETIPFVRAAAEHDIDGAADLLERLDKSIGPERRRRVPT